MAREIPNEAERGGLIRPALRHEVEHAARRAPELRRELVRHEDEFRDDEIRKRRVQRRPAGLVVVVQTVDEVRVRPAGLAVHDERRRPLTVVARRRRLPHRRIEQREIDRASPAKGRSSPASPDAELAARARRIDER
jgi:hypothetical protein